jgi:hypothetical protein
MSGLEVFMALNATTSCFLWLGYLTWKFIRH